MFLWDELLPQAELTLNLLRSSRVCPNISAYAHLNGIFNFNATPLAPPGVRAILFKDPKQRTSYGTHGTEAFYLGPALEHYRCCKFFIPTTGKTRIGATAQFFPHQLKMPIATPNDNILLAAKQLIKAIKNPGHILSRNIQKEHSYALQKLSDIFNKITQLHPKNNTNISNKTIYSLHYLQFRPIS